MVSLVAPVEMERRSSRSSFHVQLKSAPIYASNSVSRKGESKKSSRRAAGELLVLIE